MSHAELIEKLACLPQDKQEEVIDFVDFLLDRCGLSGSVRSIGQGAGGFPEPDIPSEEKSLPDSTSGEKKIIQALAPFRVSMNGFKFDHDEANAR